MDRAFLAVIRADAELRSERCALARGKPVDGDDLAVQCRRARGLGGLASGDFSFGGAAAEDVIPPLANVFRAGAARYYQAENRRRTKGKCSHGSAPCA